MNELNLNQAECIKQVSNIGNTVYKNICNGTSQVVGWGNADWLGAITLSILAFMIIGFVLFMVIDLTFRR